MLQEVHEQIKANHPNYDAYVASIATNETAIASPATESKLSARGGKVSESNASYLLHNC